MNSLENNPRWQILLKEIDLIHSNIKNLDDIIYKTKNFAILFWGGSLYLIVQHLKSVPNVNALIILTAIIPVMFWAMHFRWQKHLSMCSQREQMLSFFINSPAFEEWLPGEGTVQFPLYDIPGWLYTKNMPEKALKVREQLGVKVDSKYLLDSDDLSFWKILFYKDAKWYYSMMFLISVLFGLFYSPA